MDDISIQDSLKNLCVLGLPGQIFSDKLKPAVIVSLVAMACSRTVVCFSQLRTVFMFASQNCSHVKTIVRERTEGGLNKGQI